MKILIITTSNDHFGEDETHKTGVWLEEFAVPFVEFRKSGAELTVASPKGGAMLVDPRTAPTAAQASDWAEAIEAARQTIKITDVSEKDFDALFLPGGHGPMFDLPDDADLQKIVREFYENGKIGAAVCHGPCGLVNVKLSDGSPLVKGKTVTSYTYDEEVAADFVKVVPFILEHALENAGANFIRRENKADHIERDGQLITGQNPNSSVSIAEAVVAALHKEFQPRFNRTPREIKFARIVAEFPPKTFLENLVVAAEDNLFASDYETGKIYRVNHENGEIQTFAELGGKAAGIVFEPHGDLLVAGSNNQTQVIYRVTPNGEKSVLLEMPDAVFLNGMTHLTGNRYLVADSYKAAIWEIDAEKRAAKVWLESERLAHAKDKFHPVPMFPGANGIKIFGGFVYVSSTQQQFLLRVALNPDFSAGNAEVFLSNINIDDFAFAANGDIYAATHVYSNVVRITPDRIVTIVGEENLTGSTAIAFGQKAENKKAIFVTTNGGMSFLAPEKIEPARIVRIETNSEGAKGEI